MSDYALEGPKWTTPVVTWSFASASSDFTGMITGAYQDIVRAAIATWAGVTNLTFKQVSDSTPGVDIRIGWDTYTGSQIGETTYAYRTVGGTQTFVPGVLVGLEDPAAHPVGTSLTSRYQGTSTTLYQVALHEFGHSLGLDHSTDTHSIMYPVAGLSNLTIDASDIEGIHVLYGVAAAAPIPSVTSVASGNIPVQIPTAAPVPAGVLAVYRFFDTVNGTQFLTGSLDERNATIATRPDLTYEGLGLTGISPDADDPHALAVFRFFDSTSGTHFLTTSVAERDMLQSTRLDMRFEGSNFAEHSSQQAGDSAVYRFFDTRDGTHFFTPNAAEKLSIQATRADMTYEGVAFYAPSAG